jgi:hypothetical protein
VERGKEMRTPEEAYLIDPIYHSLCDSLEKLIIDANLTPSEVREIAMLACIHYEYHKEHISGVKK